MKVQLQVGAFLVGGALILAGCTSTSDVGVVAPSPAVSATEKAATTYVLSKDFCAKVPLSGWKELLRTQRTDFGSGLSGGKGKTVDCRAIVEGGQSTIWVNVTLLRGEVAQTSPAAGEAMLRDASALAEVAAKARPQVGPKRCGIRVVDGNVAIEIEVLRLEGGDPEEAICQRMPAFLLEVLQVLPVKA